MSNDQEKAVARLVDTWAIETAGSGLIGHARVQMQTHADVSKVREIPIGRSHDPFDIPAARIPPGLSYQWVDPEEPKYAGMAKTGWQPVPFERHADFFDTRYNDRGFIKVGGQILISRLKEVTTEARLVEMDKAFANTRSGLNKIAAIVGGSATTNTQCVRVAQVTVPIVLSPLQADAAAMSGISNEAYAKQKIDRMLDGRERRERTILLPNLHDGGLMFATQTVPRERIPRHRLLVWLFNIVSIEQ